LPWSICFRIAFTFKRFRGIDVMTAKRAEQRTTIMTTFTIDEQNNITAFPSQEEAAAATATPFDSFGSQKELAELVKAWPPERLVAIFNSLTGVTPVESFKSSRIAASRVWERIKGLGAPEEPEPATKPKAKKDAKSGAQSAKGAPAKGKATRKAPAAKKTPKAKTAAKEAAGPREGSKMAQVIAMLSRKNGATLNELAEKFSWKVWSVRGFIAGALKKAGYTVESFKSDKGERTYRINQ
jgi:hypothetical protein